MAAEAKYDMTVHPTHALVRSQSNGAAAHQVTFPSCDCADFINRRGRLIEAGDGIAVTLCKHIVAGLEMVGGWHRPAEPEPGSFAAVGLDRADMRAYLAGRGVSVHEATRALNEAALSGRSRAGLPGSGAVPLTFADGLYTVTR